MISFILFVCCFFTSVRMWVFGDRQIRVVQGGLPGMTTYQGLVHQSRIVNAKAWVMTSHSPKFVKVCTFTGHRNNQQRSTFVPTKKTYSFVVVGIVIIF